MVKFVRCFRGRVDQVSSMINVLTGITDNNGVKESITSADALGAGDRGNGNINHPLKKLLLDMQRFTATRVCNESL